MAMKLLFDRLQGTLEHNLDLRLERSNMLSANVANVDTPGYTPVDLKFDEQLAQFLKGDTPVGLRKTEVAHRGPDLVAPRGEAEFDFHALPDADGNSVDLDHEMSKLAENQLLYRAMSKVYNKRTALMKYAIAEGNA